MNKSETLEAAACRVSISVKVLQYGVVYCSVSHVLQYVAV